VTELSSPVLMTACRRRAVVEIEVGGEIEDRVAGDQVDSPLAEVVVPVRRDRVRLAERAVG